MSGRRRILATFFATLTGVMPQEPRMTWLALTLMPMMTSRFASTQAIVRSMSMERMSMSSLTRLQATRPIDPMLRKARMRSRAGSITYSRKPWKFASPAEPASTIVVTPRSTPQSDGRIEMSVPPCHTWACRSVQPGETNAPLPSTTRAPSGAFKPGDAASIAPDAPMRMSIAPCGCPLPKATGFTLDRKSGV